MYLRGGKIEVRNIRIGKDTSNNKKTGLYIRVSTNVQFEEGYSVGAQTEKLEKYCNYQEIDNYDLYIDGGYSGSNLNRPEMKRLIKEIQEGKVESVVVVKLDRLSRSQKDTIYLLEDVFEANGVGFISLNENFDTTTPYGKAMVGILSVFAQYERENIRERTQMGITERIKTGKWRGTKPPFGYDYNNGDDVLVPNKDAETVRKIFALYKEGYSTYALAKMFDLKGDKQVSDMLSRVTYIGKLKYNKEIVDGLHEPIVDKKLFDEVQELRKTRTRATSHKSQYLLTGLIYCGLCGAKMRYQKWSGGRVMIYCYSLDHSKPHLVKNPNCQNGKLDAAEVEEVVVNDMLKLSKEYEIIEGKSEQQNQKGFEAMNQRKTVLEGKLKSLYNLYASDTNNNVLLETIGEINKELENLNTQIEQYTLKNTRAKDMAARAKAFKSVADSWEFMSFNERQKTVREYIKKIKISNDYVEIEYNDLLTRQ